MPISLWYKGLSPEDRICAQNVESSAAKAKGTLYEAWFDVLQISPWYCLMAKTGEFPSNAARDTYEQFEDLRGLKFVPWWRSRGYQIFAEQVPYYPTRVADLSMRVKHSEDDLKPPVLTIEVPLNLAPAALREQFMEILRRQEDYAKSYDRWDHSTAPIHQHRESKLTYQTIRRWLDVYAAYEQQKDQKDFRLYNFAKELELHPTMFRGLSKKGEVPQYMRTEAANVASDYLKRARNLMANATEGRFPDTDQHDWALMRAARGDR